jgi:hypothetical protein
MRLNTKRLPGSWAREGSRFRLMFHPNENGARPIGEKYTTGVDPTRDFLQNKIGLTDVEATRHIAEAESSVAGTAFLENLPIEEAECKALLRSEAPAERKAQREAQSAATIAGEK